MIGPTYHHNHVRGAHAESNRVAVLLAVTRGATTLSDIAGQTGLGRSSCYTHVVALRDAGLVGMDPGTSGTIRPLVREVAVHR